MLDACPHLVLQRCPSATAGVPDGKSSLTALNVPPTQVESSVYS